MWEVDPLVCIPANRKTVGKYRTMTHHAPVSEAIPEAEQKQNHWLPTIENMLSAFVAFPSENTLQISQ